MHLAVVSSGRCTFRKIDFRMEHTFDRHIWQFFAIVRTSAFSRLYASPGLQGEKVGGVILTSKIGGGVAGRVVAPIECRFSFPTEKYFWNLWYQRARWRKEFQDGLLHPLTMIAPNLKLTGTSGPAIKLLTSTSKIIDMRSCSTALCHHCTVG